MNRFSILLKKILILFNYIEKKRHKQFFLLIIFSLLASIAEVISLGSVVPFISGLTSPETILKYIQQYNFSQYLNIYNPNDIVLPFTLLFITATLLAGIVRLIIVWLAIRLANSIGAELSTEVFRRTLYQPYHIHLSQSSNEVISGVTHKASIVSSLLLSLVNLTTSTILFLAILSTIILINPIMAIGAFGVLGGCYFVMALLVKNRLRRNSEKIALEQTNVIKSLQEGLGSIRDVILEGSQEAHSNYYYQSMEPLAKAGGENTYINQAPRFVIESAAMLLIAIFGYKMKSSGHDIGPSLSMLAALGLGAQRLMPLLQQIYGNWSVLIGGQKPMDDVLALLQNSSIEQIKTNKIASETKLKFNNNISFNNICFNYPNHPSKVLDNFNWQINKGERIGIIGESGSGKSTILDLLMGLLSPTSGKFFVDEIEINLNNVKSWQNIIAHVPQSVFLIDATIAENIALGFPKHKIEMDRVLQVAKQAQLYDFIETCPLKYNEIVGERGARLSGGQRQRIGIARALYKNAKLLIFDEATSALDDKTENSIMDAIYSLSRNLTLVMVAHRYSSLKGCDRIVKLNKGIIEKEGTYDEMEIFK